MRSAVYVGVLMGVKVRQTIDHRLRLLSRRCVIKPHQRMSVDTLLQHRKIPAHCMHIKAWVTDWFCVWHTLRKTMRLPRGGRKVKA
jgi:hypothetical protein